MRPRLSRRGAFLFKRWLWRRLNREGIPPGRRKQKSRLRKQRASCNTATGWLNGWFSPYSFASPLCSGFAHLFFYILAHLFAFCQSFLTKNPNCPQNPDSRRVRGRILQKFFLHSRMALWYTRWVKSKTGVTRRRKAKGTYTFCQQGKSASCRSITAAAFFVPKMPETIAMTGLVC